MTPSGTKETYQYSKRGEVTKLTNKKTDGTLIDEYTYTYDDNGNQLTKTENRGTTTYTYDSVNRLKEVQEPGGIKTTFEYDKAGNRTAQIEVMAGAVKLTNYSYNNKNQLERETLQEAGKTIEKTYHYDANGNLVSKADHQIQALSDKDLETVALSLAGDGSTDALTLYQYNEYNQLIKTITGNQTIAYGYNIEGYRDAKHMITQNKTGSISEETLLFIYDGSKVILETDITGNIKAENTYGLNLIARKADNEKAYYLYNAHGDVTALTDPAGKILGTYQYDAFGNIREKTYEKPNPYTYAGYRYDEEIDLYYLNARYYDPKIARFITQDTYKGQLNDPLSLNLYTYCANNPITYHDPTGHFIETIIGATIGAAIAATKAVRDKERSGGGSSTNSSSGSSTQTGNNSGNVMKSNQFNETIYHLMGLTTYFALKSTNIIAEKTSSRESIMVLSAPVTLISSTTDKSIVNGVGSLVAYKPDDSILGENKTTVNNGPTWVEKLKDAALYIKDKAIDTSKLIPATIILTGYYLNEYKESIDLLKGPIKASSKALRENLVKAGVKAPDYPNAAHHIVAGTSQKANESRAILQKFGIGINDAANGVFLPTAKEVAESAYHPSLHTNAYYNKVNDLLREATSKEDVLDILDDIADHLLNGTFMK